MAGLSYLVIVVAGLVGNLVSNDLRAFLAAHGFTQTRLLFMFAGLVILGVLVNSWLFKAQKNAPNVPLTKKTDSEGDEPTRALIIELKTRYKKRKAQKLDGRSEISLLVHYDSRHNQPSSVDDLSRQVASAKDYIIEQFERRGRLLIIGSPGSGKTVLLLTLAEYLAAKAEADSSEALPVILNLDSWSGDYNTFHDWVSAMLTRGYGLSSEFAGELLANRRIVFLLDGLDELARNEPTEIAAQIRAACLAAVDDVLYDGTISVVICCREEEYVAVVQNRGKQPTMPAITVQKLDVHQIESALCKASETKIDRFAAPRMLAALHDKKDQMSGIYEKVLSTPFYFTTALQVFDSPTPPMIDTSNKESFELTLIQAFLSKKLDRTRNSRNYSVRQTVAWLSWLAKFLVDGERVTFELADLQPSFLKRRWQYRLLFGFIYAAIGWLILSSSMIRSDRVVAIPLLAMIGTYILADDIGHPILQRMLDWNWSRWRNIFLQALVASVSFATLLFMNRVWATGVSQIQAKDLVILAVISLILVPVGLAMFALSGLLLRMARDLIRVIFDKIVADKILTEDFATWKLSPLKSAQAWAGISTQVFGLAVAAATVMAAAFATFGIVSTLTDKDTFEEGVIFPLLFTAYAIAFFICVGALFGAVYGTIFGLLIGVIRQCRKTARFAKISSPYQRLRAGISSNILQLLIVLSVMVFVPGLVFEFRSTIRAQAFRELAVPILATSSLGFFKTAIFKQFVLRVCFFLERAMPLRYAHFLTYATELRILEEDGGQWRFRHEILQDYFYRL
jgi:NACHT domain